MYYVYYVIHSFSPFNSYSRHVRYNTQLEVSSDEYTETTEKTQYPLLCLFLIMLAFEVLFLLGGLEVWSVC